ncbi:MULTISPECIES: PTS transporter subunit EIIC [Aeromonas]|uniref:PTS N-acetylglucosamine transporter subunit IIBC n=1 Tax=Aeromonas taiwanensis TaxID=633417 RepID=A0A5F0K701_9GAMM|nr:MULTISPECIES: PTS transporter subunit EIIC [Aeromonas]QXB53175.1 PTS transporter subunit EIIC [Aeromonas sp. FDAARGOS 1415]TFF72319.1 PTS N-acetylglucosamine transporter subunit IIBC [Aeromonas taiwanensis]TFF72881.1 PTS N-acetylglucosamine transporter subunit IIBC [Aeromonas taiwanensis]TFF75702.1 PTS N-acetylglucosamine transporter subunit IIBC [Aeromonas taiwanensis]
MPATNARKILTQSLQRLGYALLLPVSILPLAALLHRLGQPDVLDLAVLSLAGQALFSQMPLIYAVAIAFGLSRQGQGAQALAGAVNFLLLGSALNTLVPGLHADMICGLLAGLTTAVVCSWARGLRLPGWLRPLQEDLPGMLLSALACLLLVIPLSILWPLLEQGITLLASDLLTTPIGAFCYGVLNRLLIPLGLHQVLGSLMGLGESNLQALSTAQPLHEGYVAGLYPVIMFGLPGACFAIWLHRQRMRQVPQGGLLLTLALTSALVGITEPIEFLFAFTAPWLFLAHALLTGLSLAICSALGIQVGTYFSAGLLDMVLSYSSGQHSFWLIPLGILFFVLYALLFSRLLEHTPLSLPGKPIAEDLPQLATVAPTDPQMLAIQYLKTLGGMDNLQAMNVCLTRLSLRVREMALVDQSCLARLGCLSWIVLNEHQLVLVLGPNAGLIEGQIRMLAERQSVPLGLEPGQAPLGQHQ